MMSTLLGATEHENVVEETKKAPFAAELLKRIALGGGISVGATVAWGAFEILRDNPHDAFSLLRLWGPWAVVSLFAIYVVYDVTKMVLGIAQRGVIAIEQSSSALQQIAGKDDRQLQELQTLTAYTSQESERQSTSLRDAHAKLDQVLGILSTRNGEKTQ